MVRVAVADVHDTGASPAPAGSGAAVPARPRADGLVRDRLTARMLDPSSYRVGWVVAPAGSGKSRLLAHVADSYAGPLAWCGTPDPVPRSEAALVAWLWEGLRAGGLDWAAAKPSGLAELLDRAPVASPPLVVVLDDVHLLEGGEAEGALGRLVSHLPSTWRLLMASRMNLSIDLSRLRVSGEVVDIGPDELRFRTWEVEELFRDVYREPLLPEDVAVLTRRTAGWAAYLQMFFLATSRRSVAQRRVVLGTLQHRTRLVSEYLGRHVLAGLDPGLQDFLIRTSALRRPSARLCDEFLDRADGSAALLAELERRQLFTERLADDSYRYHAVLVAYLDSKLVETLGLDAARGEHRRAGELLEREGLMEEALAAYARSEDWDGMARVVGRLGAEHAHLDDSWAEALPPAVLESDPLLLMARARSAVSRGALAEAAATLRRAEAVAGSAAIASRCRTQREQILAWAEADRPAGTDWIGEVRRATQRHPQETRRRAALLPGPTGRFAEGCAAFVAGDAQTAARIMRNVSAHPDVPGAVATAAALVLAASGILLDRPLGADATGRVREDVESAGMRWLGRMVRAALAGLDPAGDDVVDDLVEACQREGDIWGVAVITGIDGFRRMARRDQRAEAVLARAAGAMTDLGAGSLDAVLTGYAALAARATGRVDEAAGHAERARALGMALDVPLAAAMAGLAAAPPGGRSTSQRILEPFGTWEWHLSLLDAPEAPERMDPPPAEAPTSGGPALAPARLGCLGGYLLEIGGRELDDQAAKPMERALLHLLSIRVGAAVHRETLVGALWPDADPDAGLHRLQVAVSSLRRLIGAAGGDGNEILARAGDAYRLALPEGASVDVVSFEQAVRRAEAARASGDTAAEKVALDEALAVYGGPLLPGDGPAEWVVEPRRWYSGMYADVSARLATVLLAEEQGRQAVRVARAGLGADRYRDDLWKLLIDAAEQSGNHAEAEQARRDYEAVLSDLGV